MTKNSREKRAVRAYQADHPGITYPAAKRIVRNAWAYMKAHPGTSYPDALRIVEARPAAATPVTRDDDYYGDEYFEPSIADLLASALAGDEQLLNVELSIDPSAMQYYVDIGPDIEEGPVDVDDVAIDTKTLTHEVYDEFEGGTVIGEANVEAVVTWSACVYKATYYAAAERVPWYVIDHDWNDHYVRVQGEIRVELAYHFQKIELEDGFDELNLQGLTQLPPRRKAAS